MGNFQITSSDSNLSRFYIKTKIKDIKKVHNNSLKNKSNYPQLIWIQTIKILYTKKYKDPGKKMDNFLAQVEKEMIKLRKKNFNIINEFKIEMHQTRKNIDRQLIEK